MSEPVSPEIDSPAGQRFQFSLWTMLVLVTGLSVLLSLVLWRASLGSLIGIPVVSIWWTIAAIRAGRRRLAYYLITPAMGVIVCLLISTLSTPLPEDILKGLDSSGLSVLHWICIWTMCLATLATAAILRRWIRARSPVALGVTIIASAYVAALVFAVFVASIIALWGGGSLLSWLVLVGIAAVCSLYLTSLSLHVAAPASLAFCFILRYIDPREDDLIEA